MPASPPTAVNIIEEKENNEPPQSIGMYPPIADPINIPIQIVVLDSI